MKRHGLSVIALIVAVVTGLATSRASNLDFRFTRSEKALIVLNANDFDWCEVEVVIKRSDAAFPHDASPGTWAASIDRLRPGESFRVPFASLTSRAGVFDPAMEPEAVVEIMVTEADDMFHGRRGGKLADVPRERLPLNLGAPQPETQDQP